MDKANSEIQGDYARNVSACLQAEIKDGRILVNPKRGEQEVLCLLKTPLTLHKGIVRGLQDYEYK